MRRPAVETLSITAQQDRALAPFADREMHGACRAWHEWDDGRLAALAEDPQGAVPTIEAEIADVGVARLAYPQPVQPEQHRQRGPWVSEVFGGEQEPAELCAVDPVSLAWVHLRPPDVLLRVRCDPTDDVREPVQSAHRRQAPIDRRCREPALFHVMTEQLDVRTRRCEHLEATDCARANK